MASGFGELVLVVGDHHIPTRASEIPDKFQKMLVPNKMQHVLCTGNLVTKEQFDELRNLAPNVHVVAGDCDQEGAYPETKVVTIGQFRIGLCHGHQVVPWGDQHSLAALQRKMNVDILVTGHTHVSHIRTENGKWFVNPGSITGAFSSSASEVIPSFMLMALQGPKVVAFLYELKGDNVAVSKRSSCCKMAIWVAGATMLLPRTGRVPLQGRRRTASDLRSQGLSPAAARSHCRTRNAATFQSRAGYAPSPSASACAWRRLCCYCRSGCYSGRSAGLIHSRESQASGQV